ASSARCRPTSASSTARRARATDTARSRPTGSGRGGGTWTTTDAPTGCWRASTPACAAMAPPTGGSTPRRPAGVACWAACAAPARWTCCPRAVAATPNCASRTRRASASCATATAATEWGRRCGRATMCGPRSSPRSLHVTESDDARNGVSRTQTEEAVRTLLRWAGEDPQREGLLDTPKRVVKAYGEWFSGYALDPDEYLARTFEEVAGYDEMIVLRDIEFESHCEHHMAPIIGRVHVGYLPAGKVVGISKLARVVEAYAKRFQVQEKMTAQIAGCIRRVLAPLGVGVVVDASHECMTTRGVHKRGVSMVTSTML